MSDKSPESSHENCKAPARKKRRPPRSPAVAAALTDALRTGNLQSALDAHQLTFAEVCRHAAEDPETAALLLDVRATIRTRARLAIEAAAAGGDLRAVRAIADGTLDRLDPDSAPQLGDCAPHVLAAMTTAALLAQGQVPPSAEDVRYRMTCPQCGACVYPPRRPAGLPTPAPSTSGP